MGWFIELSHFFIIYKITKYVKNIWKYSKISIFTNKLHVKTNIYQWEDQRAL